MGHGNSKSLAKEDVKFLQEHTQFSRDKIMHYYRSFLKQNPEGYLTKEQFLEMTSSISPADDSKIMNEHMFRAADKDGTGKIDFKELILMLNLRFTRDPRERLGWVFDLYDIDRSGTIEREEMVQIFKLMLAVGGNGQSSENQTDQSVEGHGQNQSEFEASASNLTPEGVTAAIFDFCDTDKNNILTKEEFIEGGLRDAKLVQFLGGCSTL